MDYGHNHPATQCLQSSKKLFGFKRKLVESRDSQEPTTASASNFEHYDPRLRSVPFCVATHLGASLQDHQVDVLQYQAQELAG